MFAVFPGIQSYCTSLTVTQLVIFWQMFLFCWYGLFENDSTFEEYSHVEC
jgi:hypothetical protein